MSLKSWIKKRLDIPETKSKTSGKTLGELLGYQFGICSKFKWLADSAAWNYYSNVSPVGHAVDLRTNRFSSVFPSVFDTKEKRFLTSEEANRQPIGQVLKLLENPSADRTTQEFLKSTSTSYPVTGDVFMLAKAISKESKPVSVQYINPVDVDTFADNDQIEVGKHQLQYGAGVIDFFPEETRTGTRFFTKDERWELYHIRTFNPRYGTLNSGIDFRGMSNLNALFIEIEQHISGNWSNYSTLENGMRPSGMLELAERITDPTIRDHLRTQIKAFYSGSSNAGEVMVLDGLDPQGDGLKGRFTQLSLNNKDMDFANLLKMDKRQIYNNLGAPLPLVEGESQTFSNFQHADAILYTGEILPFAKIFYAELTRFLLPRFDKRADGRYILAIDPENIPALEVVNTEIKINKIKSNVLTYDESRDLLGYGPLKTGGAEIYQAATLVSIGQAADQKQLNVERLTDLMTIKGYSKEEIKKQTTTGAV